MKKYHLKQTTKRIAALALATVMLGSGVQGLTASTLSVSAAGKFTYDGKNISKYKGSNTFVWSKNETSKSLAAVKSAYKKNKSAFLKVKKLEIGNDVTKISAELLSYFPNTKTLVLGKKVADVPESDGFTAQGEEILEKLSKFEVKSGNSEYSAKDGVLYNKSKSTIIKVPAAYTQKTYSMPSSVRKLASDYSLVNCDNIKSLTLSKSFEGKLRKLNLLKKLSAISVAAGNTDYKAINGVLYSADETKLICWPVADGAKTVTFPASLKELNVDALPKTVTSLKLPKSLSSLYSDDTSSEYYPKKYPLNALPKLTTIEVEEGNKNFTVDGGGLYNLKKTVCYGIPVNSATANIVIPEGMESVTDSLFYNHKTISTVSIPKTMKLSDPTVLGGADTMESLTAFTVAEGNQSMKAVDGVLFSADDKVLYVYPIAKPGNEYVIPDTVEIISANAFSSKCKNIKKLTIGKSVKQIKDGIELPSLAEYVVSDENGEFCARDGVLYLKNMTAVCGYPRKKTDKTFEVDEDVQELEYFCDFKNDYLKELDIQGEIYFPKNFNEKVPKIESFSAGSDSGYKAKNGVLYNDSMSTLICYPSNKESSEFIVPDTVKTIRDDAFSKNTKLKKLVLNKKISYVRNTLGMGCEKLTSIEVDKKNKNFTSKDGVLYNKKMTKMLIYPQAKKVKSFTILNSVKDISCDSEYILKNRFLKKLKVKKDNKYFTSDGKTVVTKKKRNVVLTLIPSKDEETE